ncbi:class I adenylate-forming enzyme family protein [Kyrpidia spormannii]|uniref:AMP-dependent synthetase n=1 Tax=Kyrpidia spormannii TaxID=2055160 RepID=A0A6F9EBH1_9BACL|nr:AMP-binding protein [Kyrpidia spormannii]CAB3394240.1 AMP-dependent synthetase [Kyrpidia spormannii]
MVRSPSERRRWLESRFPTWPRRTLTSHMQEMCREFADRPFIMTADRNYSYREVWQQARSVAKALLALGVKRRNHVALLMANEPEYVFVKFAVAMVGAVAVPLNTLLREDELHYMIRQSDSRWLVMHWSAGGMKHGPAVTRLLARMDDEGERKLQQVVYIGDGAGAREGAFLSWESFLQQSSSVSDQALEERMRQSEYPDEVSDIIYTSGTTGLPKGVMLTHDNFLRCAYSTTLSRAFEEGRRIFTPLPYYHVFAYEEGLLAVSFVGGAIISMPEFHPREALALMETHRATDFLCVPSMLVAILNHPDRERFDLGALHSLMCAAAPAPVPIWERAVKELGVREICTGYGGTEVTASTVHTEVGDPIDIVVSRVGRIKPAGSTGLPEFGGANVQYKVVDPYTGEDLPEGAVGELTARGNIVTRGYYNKPEETAAVIDKDGWFRTGDLGRIDENGYIEFLGRSKEMYKVSGENVSPKEVEEVISRHPAVGQVYVVGVPDPLTTEVGAAFIELKPGATLTRREVARWCQDRLAKFKVPRYVWFVEPGQWPMTGTGKIQKFKLQEMAQERLTQPASYREGRRQ